jgi:hypothetical protein
VLLTCYIKGVALIQDKNIAYEQKLTYHQIKKVLLQNPNFVLIVCDFIKHQLFDDDCQDLI